MNPYARAARVIKKRMGHEWSSILENPSTALSGGRGKSARLTGGHSPHRATLAGRQKPAGRSVLLPASRADPLIVLRFLDAFEGQLLQIGLLVGYSRIARN